MTKSMHRNWKIMIVLIALTVVATDAAIWAVYSFYQPFNPLQPLPPPATNPGDLEVFYIAQTVVSSLNLALLVLLVAINIDIFRKTRSKFTFGLLIFTSAFLIKDLSSNPLIIWLFGFRPTGLGPFALLPDLFEFIVLVALIYISFE